MSDSETGATPAPVRWRVTGVRRWLPVLLLVCFVANSVLRLVGQGDDPWRTRDVVLLVVELVGSALAAAVVLSTWRTRVTLRGSEVEVRGVRSRHVAYADVGRVYRDRFTAGGVTLLLKDDTKVVLPAPLAGLGVGSAEVDAAVEAIRARLPG